MRSGLTRVAGFALIPVIGIVSPLLALPLVTSRHGAAGWAAVAQGQALGAALAVLVGLGWSLNGPQAVATATPGQRPRLYSSSLVGRVPVFMICTVLGIALCPVLQPNRVAVTALSLAGAAAIGLSPSWFYIGLGLPRRVLYSDALPKLAAVSISCLALYEGAGLWVYPATLLVASLFAPFAGAVGLHLTEKAVWRFDRAALAKIIEGQKLSSLGQLASTFYLTMPIVLIGFVAPGAVAVFGAADRLQRMGINVLAGFPLALQNWIGSAPDETIQSARLRQSFAASTAVGLAAGAVFWALAPWASRVIFSGEASITSTMAFWCALIILFTCVSLAVGSLGLVARDRIGWLAGSACVGAAVGVPLLLITTPREGATGALACLALAEGLVLAVQVFGYARPVRNPESAARWQPASS